MKRGKAMTMPTNPIEERAGLGITRRRTLGFIAGVAGLALAGGAAAKPSPIRWQGSALGARAQLVFYGLGESEAQRLIALSLAEVQRLERIFSLYRADSALVRLNREGQVSNPPLDLVALLDRARFWSDWSEGAFDVTVQPLWRVYRNHFAADAASPSDPSERAIEIARSLVDYRALAIDNRCIALLRPGMAVTLNGIAQGYIADRVADLLRREGMEQVLVDMGELRALGSAPGAVPWRVGLAEPAPDGGTGKVLDIVDRAVATSAPAGTTFEPSGRFHHLLNPASGRPSQGLRSVSVVSKSAGDADALSTALAAGSVAGIRRDDLPASIDRILVDGLAI